jgi:hypothetical protein
MGILNIRQAKRAGAKVILGIAGQSGTGKTLTALYIARGMVDRPSEIGFLDTENKRGSLYSDELDGPFLIGDLYPPFSPERYSQAIKEFQASGVKVLVIDSITHEWEGEGGCIDIAENTNSKIANWKKAKAEHKKFMNVLLQADMDIICCVRAREVMDFRNPKEPVSLGIQPICEKNFMFEMTASIMMYNEGRSQQHLKVPKELKAAFGDGSNYIGQKQGAQIRSWVNAGEVVNPEIRKWESELQMSTSGGMKSLAETWGRVPAHVKPALTSFKDQCKASAEEYDRMALEQENSGYKYEPEIPDDGFVPPSADTNKQAPQQQENGPVEQAGIGDI